MTRIILHVDMDAFYAAVEQRDNPALRGKPVIVGADPKQGKGRGIVATCSYEARKFGVHSAQPISEAWKRCPQGIYVSPHMSKYVRTSQRIMRILGEFTDLIEPLSIDEAFLDVTGCSRLLGPGIEIARKIKERIRRDEKLTASVGVAENKFLAKVASDIQKPDGLVVVPLGGGQAFLDPLPISRLWGVGSKTEASLAAMGLTRIGQLARVNEEEIVGRLGNVASHLRALALGIDTRPVCPEGGHKSIGHEITFDVDTRDGSVLRETLLGLTEKVAHRLRQHRVCGLTFTVKLREADFTTHTRQVTLSAGLDTSERIFPTVLALLDRLYREGRAYRLVGVYAGNLVDESARGQLSLFGSGRSRDRKLAAAIDDITRKFGDEAITRGTLVRPDPAKPARTKARR